MRALVLHATPSGPPEARVEAVDPARLPAGAVRVDVSHSSLNYKDGLAVTGRGRIVRGAFPFVPGIDAAGTVAADASGAFAPGTPVALTGWGTGEDRWGGFADTVQCAPEHLVALPAGLSPARAMAFGTAGLTAALALDALAGVPPDAGDVAVTGASGGVGAVAVALLARAGYRVVAVTGTPGAGDTLRALGAAEVAPRDALAPGPPLGRARWAAAVDVAGGEPLATLLATTGRHGVVAACGLAASAELTTTVFPFILRGVTLAGIDSNTALPAARARAWARLAEADAAGAFAALPVTTVGLGDVSAWADRITRGDTVGRVVVDVRA